MNKEGATFGKLIGAIHEKTDVENDSESPIFDRFNTNGGSQTLIEMSNFK